METKEFYTGEEIVDKYIGPKGTPKREKLEADLQAFLVGDAVPRTRISRIENGKDLNFSTLSKVFKAMGIRAKLEMGDLGKVSLW